MTVAILTQSYKDTINGETPLHLATDANNLAVVERIIKEIKKRAITIYNEKNDHGQQPVCLVKSSSAVLLFLKAFQDQLELVRGNEFPLLFHCIAIDIVNEEVITHLSGQLQIKFRGWTPIEQGKTFTLKETVQ
jgi:ankyrin repeat protein